MKLNNPIYINGRSCISPQLTYNNDLNGLGHAYIDKLVCIEPDYKTLPAGTIGRRMVKLTKMSIYTAIHALKDAGVEIPGAIITGTGIGCTIETERFLNPMLKSDETYLNPTSFMQSTHNTIGGQIALILGCKNYNLTYVQRGLSFESALLDGIISLQENEEQTILLGGIDELTDEHLVITNRIDYWKKKSLSSKDLLWDKESGSLSGQGAAFFVLSTSKTDHSYSQLVDFKMHHQQNGSYDVENEFNVFLEDNDLTIKDIDVLLLGRAGDALTDMDFDILESKTENVYRAYFKHLCGEYYTAASFALWLADLMIKEQNVPQELLPNGPSPDKIRNIVIYNQYRNIDNSFYLLRDCRNLE